MLENRSFDHMLGALKATHPNIDGLTRNESNPDSTETDTAALDHGDAPSDDIGSLFSTKISVGSLLLSMHLGAHWRFGRVSLS